MLAMLKGEASFAALAGLMAVWWEFGLFAHFGIFVMKVDIIWQLLQGDVCLPLLAMTFWHSCKCFRQMVVGLRMLIIAFWQLEKEYVCNDKCICTKLANEYIGRDCIWGWCKIDCWMEEWRLVIQCHEGDAFDIFVILVGFLSTGHVRSYIVEKMWRACLREELHLIWEEERELVISCSFDGKKVCMVCKYFGAPHFEDRMRLNFPSLWFVWSFDPCDL